MKNLFSGTARPCDWVVEELLTIWTPFLYTPRYKNFCFYYSVIEYSGTITSYTVYVIYCTLLLVKHVVLLCKFVYEWSENEVHICGLHKSLLHPLKQSKINIYKNEVVTFPLKLWRVFKDTPFLMAKESNHIGKVRHLLVKIKYN